MKGKLFLCAMAATLAMIGCSENEKPEPVPVAADLVLVSPDDIVLVKGKTEKLTATILPKEAATQAVEWSSSDESIVTVDATGTVTGVAAGEARVTATVGGKSAFCDVRVEGILLSQTEAGVLVGRILHLTAEIFSEKADQYLIEWSSSNEDIATVDPYEGWVATTAVGEVVITATAGEMTEECRITVTEFVPAEGVGDFFYSDGTRSAELDPTKTPVGVVFWLGDPTASDPTLKKEHPDCTHGLVVALKEFRMPYLTKEGEEGFKLLKTTIGAWTDTHAGDYESIYQMRHPYTIKGYNNTKALEVFNADQGNANWPLQPIVKLQEYRESVPSPTGTSGWYMPSLKELSLLCSGVYDENLDEKEHGDIINGNVLFLNNRIGKITDASRLNTEENDNHLYWSSTEQWSDRVERIMSRINMARGNHGTDLNGNQNSVRFVLAF